MSINKALLALALGVALAACTNQDQAADSAAEAAEAAGEAQEAAADAAMTGDAAAADAAQAAADAAAQAADAAADTVPAATRPATHRRPGRRRSPPAPPQRERLGAAILVTHLEVNPGHRFSARRPRPADSLARSSCGSKISRSSAKLRSISYRQVSVFTSLTRRVRSTS